MPVSGEARRSGPLIVVGRPRSGTTLLRNLLNGHPEIALTAYESHFVPGLIKAFGAAPPFASSAGAAERGLARFKEGQLYRKGVERGTYAPSDDAVRAALCGGPEWSDVVRGLLDLYCPKSMAAAARWGDKTPRYLKHIDLLFRAMPGAVFLHIIRDPRDQALSERAIWGKSVRYAADTWREMTERARRSTAAAAGHYHEVLFEELVGDPPAELTRIAGLLGLEYDPHMVEGAAGSDELGQMVSATSISAKAVAGRRSSMSRRDEWAIASLAGGTARTLGYDMPLAPERRLRPVERRALQGYDRLAVARYHIRRRDGSLRGGISTMLRWNRERP